MSAQERIEERNAWAEEEMKTQGSLGRSITSTSVALANAKDRVISLWDNDVAAFARGSLFGGVQGATLGGVAWFVLLALTVVPAMPAVAGMFIGASAIAFGLYQGTKAIADRHAQEEGIVHERRPFTVNKPDLRGMAYQREVDEAALRGRLNYVELEESRRAHFNEHEHDHDHGHFR